MASLRLKGSNTAVRVSKSGEEYTVLIRDHEFELLQDILPEGYLGEQADRRDEVYNGVRGNLTIHPESSEIMRLLADITNRGKSQFLDAATVFSIESDFRFADSSTWSIRAYNVVFSNIPVSNPGRREYVSVKLNYESADFNIDRNL